jgi:hypothetical protein
VTEWWQWALVVGAATVAAALMTVALALWGLQGV